MGSREADIVVGSSSIRHLEGNEKVERSRGSLAPRMSAARETNMRCGCPSHLLSSRDTCYLCPSKCLCHLLTLVIGSIITTSIDVSLCRSLSSCRRTELNCGNKENERERALVCSSTFLLSFFLFEQKRRERDEQKSASREKNANRWWCLLLLLEESDKEESHFSGIRPGSRACNGDDHDH